MNHDANEHTVVDSQGLTLLMSEHPVIRRRVEQLQRLENELSLLPTPETFAEFDREAAVDELTIEYLKFLRMNLERSRCTEQLVFSGSTSLKLYKEIHTEERLHKLAVEQACSLLAGEGFYVYFAYYRGFSSYSEVQIWRRRPPCFVRMLKPLSGWESKPGYMP